jgi:hypothetical protein
MRRTKSLKPWVWFTDLDDGFVRLEQLIVARLYRAGNVMSGCVIQITRSIQICYLTRFLMIESWHANFVDMIDDRVCHR